MIKHVNWHCYQKNADGFMEYLRGLVAVKVDDDRVRLRSLAGPDIGADLLIPILSAALPEGWEQLAEELHRGKKNPWYLHTRVGMSGCRDYKIYSLQDEEFADWPLQARLHISMYGKLNEGLSCWLGDLPPLLKEIALEYGIADEPHVSVYTPTQGEIREPGNSSGFLELLYAVERGKEMSRLCYGCEHFERDHDSGNALCNRNEGRCPREKEMDRVWDGEAPEEVVSA